MVQRALGLIEVKGMLGAVLAADAAMKAADVELLGNRRIRGGLTTVQLLGDVAAIHAAVEAGAEVVKNTDSFVSSHVIARLDEQVEHMLLKKYQKEEKREEPVASNPVNPIEKPEIKPETMEELKTEVGEVPEEEIKKVLEQEQERIPGAELDPERLDQMKVVELRSLAYKRNIDSLTKKEIKYANKEQLIRALLEKGVKDE
ncbi:BMC domain-containing protein [Jeotgalibaca caeni]|uniref:BMC domain-containing protein n=1 Tax=Jeotgalibaca caeni TaxID=3028623 RepID=UPI00237D562C|nr:BMC domain-containing protein [Jeotgalibaca caeni]MDE1548755.1 BMC domain-containing protein [Jeotgalibaca caeni]